MNPSLLSSLFDSTELSAIIQSAYLDNSRDFNWMHSSGHNIDRDFNWMHSSGHNIDHNSSLINHDDNSMKIALPMESFGAKYYLTTMEENTKESHEILMSTVPEQHSMLRKVITLIDLPFQNPSNEFFGGPEASKYPHWSKMASINAIVGSYKQISTNPIDDDFRIFQSFESRSRQQPTLPSYHDSHSRIATKRCAFPYFFTRSPRRLLSDASDTVTSPVSLNCILAVESPFLKQSSQFTPDLEKSDAAFFLGENEAESTFNHDPHHSYPNDRIDSDSYQKTKPLHQSFDSRATSNHHEQHSSYSSDNCTESVPSTFPSKVKHRKNEKKKVRVRLFSDDSIMSIAR